MSKSTLLEEPRFRSSNIPEKSSQLPSRAYVLSIACLPTHYATSASTPSNVIDIFDKSTLQSLQTLPGHDIATTSLRAVESLVGISGKTLVSSGKDGSVKVWDSRSNSHNIKMTNLGGSKPLLCCDISSDGLTVAAGTGQKGDDALIVYWDPRQPATPLRTHSSTHSGDITVVSFFKPEYGVEHNTLLSASSDGLLTISDADNDDEDESVLYVGNWGCSISQAGWVDSLSGPKVWAASDMETFSTWTNELDCCQSLNIRDLSLHHERTWVTDYIISCHENANTAPNLGVFVGSNKGDIGLLSNADLFVPATPWFLYNTWSNGHAGIVRSLLWDAENNVLVTGGEDAQINIWSCLSQDHHIDNDSMNVDPPLSKRAGEWDNEQKRKKPRR